jgi:hypothetical protein
MLARQYQRLKEIYCKVCELDEESRDAALNEACAGDAALRRQVEDLLVAQSAGSAFLERPLLDGAAALVEAASSHPHGWRNDILPTSIGRYRIVRLIGQGGMGSVYEAQQESPKRAVAIKVIGAAFPSKRMVQRFQREIEILGRLHHPNIAQIYDAGFAEVLGPGGAPTRLPFYVMEFIGGLPLIEHAVALALSNRQRLEILATICDAVHFGHVHGVVHRDLKPATSW